MDTKDYDVVFMDVQMPDMDGYETTQRIRGLKQNAEVFVVAMTASAQVRDRELAEEAGMDDFIAKPFRDTDLYRVMDRLTERENAT